MSKYKIKTKKNTLNDKKNSNILFIIFVSILVFGISIIFCSFKNNFQIDELYSYGLANNQFQLLVDDYKSYTGKELINEYLSVHEGKQFDFANLFYNQSLDTHPPLWYLILHTVCSIFVGTFNKYYGLLINCFFMIFVFWKMFHLVYTITKDKLASYFIPVLSLFLHGFINSIVFTRMYIMLEAISLTFICLIVDKIINIENNNADKKVVLNDKTGILNVIYNERFYIWFILITIIGVLTQYHYILIAGTISIIFGIFLLIKKEYKVLIKSVISGSLGLVISYLVFPAMINHIFLSNSHSLTRETQKLAFSESFIYYLSSIRKAFFGNEITFMILLFIVISLVVIYIFNKNKNNPTNKNIGLSIETKILLILTIVVFVYFVAIVSTVSLTVHRYLFNIYPILAIVIFSSIYLLLSKIKYGLRYLCFLFIILCAVLSNINLPPNLYYETKEMLNFMKEHKDIKTVMAYYDDNKNTQVWKLPQPLYAIKDMGNIVFTNIAKENWQNNDIIKDNNDLFVYVYTSTKNLKIDYEDVVNKLMNTNNLESSLLVYSNTYVRLYMLY